MAFATRTATHTVTMHRKQPRASSAPEQAFTSASLSALKSYWAACKRVVPGVTFSRFQAVVGTLAGLISIVGAACSFVQLARPVAQTGRLVAIVQAADSKRVVNDAVV